MLFKTETWRIERKRNGWIEEYKFLYRKGYKKLVVSSISSYSLSLLITMSMRLLGKRKRCKKRFEHSKKCKVPARTKHSSRKWIKSKRCSGSNAGIRSVSFTSGKAAFPVAL